MKKRADGRYRESITVDGKRQYFYGSSPAEAKSKLREYKDSFSSKHPFKQLAEEWEEHHNKGLAYNTVEFYKPLTQHVIEYFGEICVEDINTLTVNDWLQSLHPKYSKKSITNHKSIMIMILSYAISPKQYINYNPAREAEIPKNAKKGRRKLPADDKIKIIDSSEGKGDALLPFLLLHSGCRRNEALALQHKHFLYDDKFIEINQQLEFHNNQPVVVDNTKTEAGIRLTFLYSRLVAVIKALPGGPDDYIFGGEKPWSYQAYRRTWERYCKSVGFIKETPKTVIGKDGKPVEKIIITPTITAHQLRHAYVTMCFEAEVDSKTAAYLAGHADEKTTREIYEHLRMKKADEAREKIENFHW